MADANVIMSSSASVPPEAIDAIKSSQIDWSSLLKGLSTLVGSMFALYSTSLLCLLIIVIVGALLHHFFFTHKIPASTPFKDYVSFGLSFFLAWVFSPMYLPIVYGPIVVFLSNSFGIFLK